MSVAAVAFMQANGRFRGIVVSDGGGITSDNGNFSTDGNGNLTILGNAKFGQLQMAQATGTVQTLATGNTVNIPANVSAIRVTAAAAVTGIIIPAATGAPGAMLCVIHEGAAANTITFAASGTSNVADGASDVITGPSAALFIWDNVTLLWYRNH
jgi:hypothetical protein